MTMVTIRAIAVATVLALCATTSSSTYMSPIDPNSLEPVDQAQEQAQEQEQGRAHGAGHVRGSDSRGRRSEGGKLSGAISWLLRARFADGPTSGKIVGAVGGNSCASASSGGSGATGVSGGTGASGATGLENKEVTRKQDCVSAVLEAENHFRSEGVEAEELPRKMHGWCLQVFDRRTSLQINTGVAHQVCGNAQNFLSRRPTSERYSTETSAGKFCKLLRASFDKLLGPEGENAPMGTGMSGASGMSGATGATGNGDAPDLESLRVATPLAKAGPNRACCLSHKEPGCFDEDVAACVCEHDSFCCQQEWDLHCAESVENFICARCPRPNPEA
jgi:hypothetical protein